MAIYLDEVHVGADPSTIGFPHLLLCMGLVLVTDKMLYGIHLTNKEDTDRAIGVFAKYLDAEGVDRSKAQRLYGSANLKTRYKSGDGTAAWRTELKQIAKLIGYSGPASGFDTSIIDPKDGTYVEYQRKLSGECRIFYKRHEKVQYGAFMHDANVQKISNTNKLRSDVGVSTPSSAAVKATFWNKGELHEVDYASRLMACTV